MAQLNTIITLRQGTTAEWASSTTILKKGEVGLEYLVDGSVKIKAGDDEHLWKDLKYIGAEGITYDFSFSEEKITIVPKLNGTSQESIQLDLSSFITAEELAEELGKLSDRVNTYSVADGEKILKLNDNVFSTELGLKHENGKISLTGVDSNIIAEISDSDFIKDSVLEDVNYDSSTKEIIFTWKTIGEETKTDRISVSDFVQTYSAGVGLAVDNNTFSIKIDTISEGFLSADSNGLKITGIQNAIDLAKQAAIDDAASKYLPAHTIEQLNSVIDGRLKNLESINHNLYVTSKDLEPIAISAYNAEIAVNNLEARFDEIITSGGEPNAINNIQVNGVELVISNKTVNIEVPTQLSDFSGWSNFETKIINNENEIKTIKETTIPGLLTKFEEVEGVLNEEILRASNAEKELNTRLEKVETFFAAVETPDQTIDTLAEIVSYIENDKTGAANMLASIQSNKNAIETIFIPASDEKPATGFLVEEITRVEQLIKNNTDAILAINNVETGIFANAKQYVDEKFSSLPTAGENLGFVKSSENDNQIKVETDGTMSVNRISMDKLYIEEGSELILNGGNAV